MGIRVILILLVVGGMGVYWGGTHFYTGLSERTPLEISCKEYAEHRPDNHYLRLMNCEGDFENAVEMTETKDGSSRITAVYIPLRAKGIEGAKTAVVLARTDDEILSFARETENAADLNAGQMKQLDNLMKEFEDPQEGLIEAGMDLDSSDISELKRNIPQLPQDFKVLDHKKSPQLLLGGLALFGGLAVFAFMLRGIVKRFRPAT